jgi:hypothetical protein
MGDLLKYGLLAVGGYLLYNAFTSPATAVPGTAVGITPTPAGTPAPAPAPSYVTTPPTLAAQLDKAAQSNSFYTSQGGKMDAFQWAYIWQNSLSKPAIDGGVISALFFPSGVPSDSSTFAHMTAADFVTALATKGISGLGAFGLPAIPRRIPKVVTLPAAIAIAHARRGNYRRAGSPMVPITGGAA